jgi:hypothetical protein
MSNISQKWGWIAGSIVLLSAAGLAVYFAQGPAQASAEETLPVRAPVSAVQTTSKQDDILPDPEMPMTPQDKRLARLDKNDNHIVELAEFTASKRKFFDKLDSDNNGALSFAEYALKTTQKFEAADANHNGKLETIEFATTAKTPAKKKCACVTTMKDES